jgi:hypothetical protein
MTAVNVKRIAAALVALCIIVVAASCGENGDPAAPSVDPISVQTTSLADAIEGQAYSQQLGSLASAGGRVAGSMSRASQNVQPPFTIARGPPAHQYFVVDRDGAVCFERTSLTAIPLEVSVILD